MSPQNTGGPVPPGVFDYVSTVAGTHHPGFANGTLTTASFYQPRDATADLSGNIYVVDDNNVVRKITPAGVVTTFAGSGALGSADGTGTAATFRYLLGIITDAAGNVYVTDSNNNMIRKITPSGVVTTLAGNGLQGAANGQGAAASFQTPCGIGIDASGNLYVADEFNNMIRKITPTGMVSTVAGNGNYGSADGTGSMATFSQPNDVTVDANGNLYVADGGNNKIRKITPAGVVTTLAGSGAQGKADGTGTTASFSFPSAITMSGGNLYVGDPFNQVIRKITLAGVVTTIAGSPNGSYTNYGDVDGVGRAAQFSFPYGIGTDGSNLLIADNQNSDIRKISLSGYTISPGLPAGMIFDETNGTISGTPTVISPATNYTVTAYNGYGSSTTTINIAVVDAVVQSITFLPLPVKTYGDADFNITASSTNSSLPFSYTSSNNNIASVSQNGKIHITGSGSCTITVSQPGNSQYLDANPVTQTLIVNPAPLTIIADNQERVYGQPNPTFTVSAQGFVYGEILANLTTQPFASTTANTQSAPGPYLISVSMAQSPNYTISYVAGTLTISKAAQTVTFASLPSKKVGDPDFLLAATSTSGLPITFSSSDPTIANIINNNEVQILKPGNVIIIASQEGDADYEPASVQQSLIVYPTDIIVPNAFTPNNDGINDKWNIAGAETDASMLMKVFNRYGTLVYQSKGYYMPWDGSVNGKPLPSATYYYIISLKNNTQKLSGFVTIIR
ncbi:MAG: gliding motility-associated C-terminal domain-containing protein [Mucilaginibacter sp.]